MYFLRKNALYAFLAKNALFSRTRLYIASVLLIAIFRFPFYYQIINVYTCFFRILKGNFKF